MKFKNRKYIVVTGGVLSGLGKGVSSASIGFFFSDDYKVVPMKLDNYLNVDPGTMNPIEHGEVFVLDDGKEVDMDFGHYERFLNISSKGDQNLTMGKVFQLVRNKERKGDYLGKTVQMIPHVTDLIKEEIKKVGNKNDADIVLIEVGGTVGDIEMEMHIEALRQLSLDVGRENISFIHMSYVPIPYGVKEQKTKPTQQSVSMLQSRGIWPNFVLCRGSEVLTNHAREKIALFANIKKEDVFSVPDVDSIYKVPQVLNSQGLVERLCSALKLEISSKKKLEIWNNFLKKDNFTKKVRVAIAGKYTGLEDSYASVVESLKHCSMYLETDVEIVWIETSKRINKDKLKKCDAVIVPGGFGSRGIEGKIEVIKFARENDVPYLGICYGLQLAVIEFMRNVVGMKTASSSELDCVESDAVITMLDEQRNIVNLGGTMRLGAYRAVLDETSQIFSLYKKLGLVSDKGEVSERHRHRYEVNPEFISEFEGKGLAVVGRSCERDLVEFIELDSSMHCYFVGTQAHPELKSKLEKPAPLFYGLIRAALKKKYG